MTHDSTNFNLTLDVDLDEFDPLEDLEADEEGEEGDQTNDLLTPASVAESARVRDELAAATAAADDRPAKERIAELMSAMEPHRKVLFSILAACPEPRPVSEVNALVDELQQNNYSVYTAANLCALLERAGAIERVTPDGAPADNLDAEPKVVVVDGVEYLEAREPVQVCWLITDAGRAALEADKPFERLRSLFEEDAVYLAIYQRILTMCTAGGGAQISAINEAVNCDPLLQEPRLYASHFIDKLEECDALAWQKTWSTTEVGRAGLELLDAVADKPAAEADSATASEKE